MTVRRSPFSPDGARLAARSAAQQPLRPLDPLLQPVLEGGVLPPILNVLGDGRPNHLGHRLIVDGSDGLELLRLVRRQADGHSFHRLHGGDHATVTAWLSSGTVSYTHLRA